MDQITSKIDLLKAIEKYGNALRYASKELQCDREVVLKAVGSTSKALQYASAQLQQLLRKK